uniref:Uncharacterized protein n=1 Tax=Arundo donax TaxID=35708 RepID=A0A0A8ZL24_ARUDO
MGVLVMDTVVAEAAVCDLEVGKIPPQLLKRTLKP